MAAPKKDGKSRVSRAAAAAKARTDGGAVNSKADLKENVARGAGPTVPGRNKPVSRPVMKPPAVSKQGGGTIAQRANAVAARRAATGK
jgi:hypothetical protein